MHRHNKVNTYALMRAVSKADSDEVPVRVKSFFTQVRYMIAYDPPPRNKPIRCWKSQSKKAKQWM